MGVFGQQTRASLCDLILNSRSIAFEGNLRALRQKLEDAYQTRNLIGFQAALSLTPINPIKWNGRSDGTLRADEPITTATAIILPAGTM